MQINNEYMAGVADSDGSFSLVRRTKQSTINGFFYRPIFQLTWIKNEKTESVMLAMKEKYGGAVCKWIRKNNEFDTSNRECLKYAVEGKGLYKLVNDLMPHLLLKNRQAQLIKEVLDIRNSWNGRNKPLELWNREHVIYGEFKSLNTKNKKHDRIDKSKVRVAT